MNFPKKSGNLTIYHTRMSLKVVYPMIKGYTDYTLHYKERNEDLSATIDTYFAIK